MKSHSMLTFPTIPRVIALGMLFLAGFWHHGCASPMEETNRNLNVSGNSNTNATNVAANASANLSDNTNESQTRPLTREEYERHKPEFEKLARESNRQIGSGSADGWIWVQAYHALNTKRELRDSKINVDVENGVVTLTGSVRTKKQKVEAVGTVQQLEGVTGVNDQLRVQPVPVSAQNFDIDRELKKLKEGAAITEAPTAMELGETRRVVLTLSPDPAEAPKVVEQTKAEVAKHPQSAPTTKIESESIRYSRFMEAKLIGQGFDIKLPPSERQPVTRNQPTVWTWDIKATARGQQYLQLTTNAIFEVPGSEPKVRSVNTFNKLIMVNVSWRTWWGMNYQWVIGTAVVLLAAVIGGLASRRSR